MYSEIADDLYYREDLEEIIPEGRKASPLIPGVLRGETADCFFTMGNIGDKTVLFHLIRSAESGIEVTECEGETVSFTGACGSSDAEKEQRSFDQYAALYPQVREIIGKDNRSTEDEALIDRFWGLVKIVFKCIPVSSLERYFPEYSK